MEDAFIIRGGNQLRGEITLSGAKNIALKVIIASLLFDQEVILKNIPKILDVLELLNLIEHLGGKWHFDDQDSLHLDGRSMNLNKVDFLKASKIRVSFMLFAPLLHRLKEAYVPNPGGCRIGARPIDRIIEGMIKLGVNVKYNSETGYYLATVSNQPHGGLYRFQKPSHTGTELLILIGVFSKNPTIIENAAMEPEIDELMNFLNSCGGKIKRSGTKIEIVPSPNLNQTSPFVISCDRNEAATFATLAVATKGSITVHGVSKELLTAFLANLEKVGAGIDYLSQKSIRFYYKKTLAPISIETSPHPGFMTDWQPNWAILMTQAAGVSTITERVFENRFSYVEELKKLGAEIDFIKIPSINPTEYFFFNFDPAKKYNQSIRIKGPQSLHNAVLTIHDLRAGAALVEAALIASGESVIIGASIIERGYEHFIEKIRSVGGYISKYE